MHSAPLFCYARHMALSDQRLLHSPSRMPFIDTGGLAGVLGEAHATVHRAPDRSQAGAQFVAHRGQELSPQPLELFQLSHVLHGHDEGLHLAVLGVDGRGVEQLGDAPSVRDPEPSPRRAPSPRRSAVRTSTTPSGRAPARPHAGRSKRRAVAPETGSASAGRQLSKSPPG